MKPVYNGDKFVTNKEYFSKAKIGLFTTYFYGPYYRPGTEDYGSTCKSAQDRTRADSLDQFADAFDAQRFARVADSMAAQYVTFTVCHAGFNILFPSKTMIEAGLPYKVSKRDVIRDLLDALAPYGIKLALYIWHGVGQGGCMTDDELRILGWGANETTKAHGDFIRQFAREIGERYENEIAGLWFDGVWDMDRSVIASVRETNKGAVIYGSYGHPADGAHFNPALMDFWTSEYYGPLPSAPSDLWPTHFSQIGKIFGSDWWASKRPVPKITLATAREMFRYTVRVAATGGQCNGGLHWAAGPYMDNSWEEGREQLMAEYGKLIRKHKEGLFDTVPSLAYPTHSGSVLSREHWGVATQSFDNSKTYLHVLNAPPSNTLRLPEPATFNMVISEGHGIHRFTRAEITGREAGLEKTGDGWAVTLPAGISWDADDTVVTLWT